MLDLTPLDHFFITITLTNLTLGLLVWRILKSDKPSEKDKDSK